MRDPCRMSQNTKAKNKKASKDNQIESSNIGDKLNKKFRLSFRGNKSKKEKNKMTKGEDDEECATDILGDYNKDNADYPYSCNNNSSNFDPKIDCQRIITCDNEVVWRNEQNIANSRAGNVTPSIREEDGENTEDDRELNETLNIITEILDDIFSAVVNDDEDSSENSVLVNVEDADMCKETVERRKSSNPTDKKLRASHRKTCIADDNVLSPNLKMRETSRRDSLYSVEEFDEELDENENLNSKHMVQAINQALINQLTTNNYHPKHKKKSFLNSLFGRSKKEKKPDLSKSKSLQSSRKYSSTFELSQRILDKSPSFIRKSVRHVINKDVPSLLKRSFSVRDVDKKKDKLFSRDKLTEMKNLEWARSLQSLVENDNCVSYDDMSFINYDTLNTVTYDLPRPALNLHRTQSLIVHGSPGRNFSRGTSVPHHYQSAIDISEQSEALSLPSLQYAIRENEESVYESSPPTRYRRRPQSISSEDGKVRPRANGSFRSAGSGCAKLKRTNACRQKSRDSLPLFVEQRNSQTMPRKQPLTCRKGKKHGKRQCPGQSNVATSASTTEELTQASDRMTQITNATTTPNSGVATSPKQPRLICTSNQPGPHEVETGDDIQKEQSNSSIRTTFARSTQATQASDRTTQIPNTIPDSSPATSPKRARPNCTCDQPGTSVERCLLHENIEEGETENAKCICEKQAGSTSARCPLHHTIRGDIDGIDDNNIPEGCICYEPGPANQRCPLHEIEPANDDIVIDDPFNDSFTEILEAADFHTPQDNNPPQPADEIDILPPIPHQVGAADYLLATTRQNIEVHNCGHLDQNCLHCNAKYFALERNSRGTYNKCCSGGNVFLAPFTQHPQELRRLFTGQHPLSREFKRNINVYNNCFQFASVQANLREIPGQGPFVYAIQGQIYHHYSDVNINREQQRFGPVYYLDPEEAIRQRVNNAGDNNVNPALIRLIEDELRNVNPYARVYSHLHRVYEEQQQHNRALNNENNLELPRVYIEFVGRRRNANNREQDLPAVPEVAAVVQYNEDVPPNPQMRVFLTDRDAGCRMIDHQSSHSDPLLYPLLFPNGELGWNMDIPLQNVRDGGRNRQRVTLCQYYNYRLAIRDFIDQHLFDIFRCGGRLTQKFVVSAFIKIEANRINYLRHNQDRLRAAEYYGLVDYLHNRGERDNVPIGRMVILPSSYLMSPRHQMQKFQDSMSIVSKIGYPSLFITFTCNPKWEEIVQNIPQGDEVNNHPLLISRVFKMKLEELIDDLTKRHIMGVCIAYLYVIEFQKRGLPHAHVLITLRNEDKFRDTIRVDQLISAEIPDQNTEPRLYELVGQHMIHGPCGPLNPASVCMENDRCTKHFPKFWYNNTTIREGTINYRRRRNNRTVEVRRGNARYQVDNSFVVPYNPYLLLKYKTHINVEACFNISTVKYLYKYFFKSTDQITLEVIQRPPNEQRNPNENEREEMRYDEIRSYLNGRYLTPPESSWHILQFEFHGCSHHVERLQIHLPGRQQVLFRDGQEEVVANNNIRTQLLSWFDLNREEEFARQWLYTEFPLHYVWRNGRWHRRQRLTKPIVPRLINVSLRSGELYYLRLLLLHVRGATSFEDIRTFNGTIYETFREACQARNLLAEDREWIRSLNEASAREMPTQLRQMFAFILVFGIVNDAPELWRQFRNHMKEDFIRRRRMNDNEAEIAALQHIQFILRINGRRLSEFGIEDPPEQMNIIEDNIDVDAERHEADILVNQLNDEQHNIFDMVIRAVRNDNEPQRLFYISGSGGVGKSYLYNCVITRLNALEIKVISVASTGIAAALLKQGRTVHSRFQLPVPIFENSTSRITRDSDDARFIRDAKFLIWDEVSMSNRLTFELVDKTIRFLCGNNDRPFGGKVVIIGGDFKQCLPIVQDGNRATVVQASIKSSHLWNLFQHHRLQTNMRVRPEEQDFIRWLERLGNNTLPTLNDRLRPNSIEIPPECVTETLDDLIQNIFGDLRPGQVLNKAILTPLNENCHLINERILNQNENQEIVYHSIDDVISDDPETRDMYPVEFLNSLTPSGFPQHTLKLKDGCIIMLLRNLNVRANLCNGTRLLVRHLGELYIDAEIIRFDGQLSNKRVFIPRIDFTTNQTSNLPFIMRRRQFPVRLSYCLTINKSQGQSYDSVGIYLPNAVFDHGQLYVACSRARSMRQLFIHVTDTNNQGRIGQEGRVYTRNIVYDEIL